MPSLHDLATPALVVDAAALEHNLATMAAALPGPHLRPHVKAHKCTALARRQAAHGHRTFTCATIPEVEGLVAVGLGDDVLLANGVLDARRLGRLDARTDVGGDVVSAGGTGTYDLNTTATEIQAGSYVLMDTAYAKLGLPFRQALSVLGTVISVSAQGYAVADVGLKALGMDHGPSEVEGGQVLLFSDEHVTFVPSRPYRPGDRVRVWPAHVDPTVAYHERTHVVAGESVVETWGIDLRGWSAKAPDPGR